MSNIAISTAGGVDDLLSALGEHLRDARPPHEFVVIGGSGLLALGLIERATRDVDVVALVVEGQLLTADPFPSALCRARDRVARDFGLPTSWLNPGPAALAQGLPDGFAERLSRRTYGPGLVVQLASRIDQIHFKLYAAVDDGRPGKHAGDLKAMGPTRDELVQAARWARQQDPSEAFLSALVPALAYFGVHGADLGG